MSPRALRIAQQGEETRAAAMDAAVELFGENGYHATSLKQIAQRAGVVQSALHHHFGSKPQLLLAVLEAHYPPFAHRPDMEAVAAGRSEFVDEVLAATRHNVEDRRLVRFFSVMTGESLTVDHPAHDFFVERYHSVRAGFVDAIATAKRVTDEADRARIALLVATLFAASDGLQMQWVRDPSVDLVGGVELTASWVQQQLNSL
ncbi:TetR/AcrR family transcriptional regulator [Streptomyces sp. NPDC102364]|uniref:TetR/AcrR family transcriptional regulator n=1 Tax=Streptomyces sp. NPDC102364 TaxID=3366161 RepID=UPI0037FC52D5